MYKNALRVIIISLIMLYSQYVSAQNQVLIDSLEKALSKAKEDTQTVNILNGLAFEYRMSNGKRAASLIDRSIQLSEKLNFKPGLALAYNHLGILNKNKKAFDEAIKYHLKALQLRKELNDMQGIASSYNNIGVTYDTKEDYSNAMKYYLQSLQIREKMNDSSGLSACYNNISRLYGKKGNMERAIEYNLKALKLRELTGDSFWVAQYSNTLGFQYYELNKFNEALSYYNRALNISKVLGDQMQISSLMNNIGNVLGETGNIDKSIPYHLSALKIQTAIQDTTGMYTSVLSLSQAYSIKHNFDKALAYSREALGILNKMTNEPKMYMDYYQVLGELYKKKGDYKAALDSYLEYGRYKDSLIRTDDSRMVTDMQVKYETGKKDLELSKKTLALTKSEYELQKKNAIAIILIISIFVISILSYLFYNRYKLKKDKELADELIKQQEIRSKAIIDAEEKERVRIAKDLHDGVGQQLSAIKLNFSSLSNLFTANVNDEHTYHTLLQMVDEAVKEVRSVSHEMMPNALLRSGLVAATREFVDKIAMNGLLKVDLQIIGLNNRFENTVESVLYRVLQEAVNNIVKHAQANKVSIQLIKHEKSLNLILEDNGKGFDTTQLNEFNGIGLKNIISRIEYLNGTVHFDSAINRGTTIDIEIPV